MRWRAAACAFLLVLPLMASAQASAPRRPASASPEAASGPARETATRGKASWYGLAFQGKPTASGEPFDVNALTAAHRTLPFGTVVEVRSLVNGRTVRVRINDRGPHTLNRMIDLSEAAAHALDLHGRGTKLVEVRVIGKADAESSASPEPQAGEGSRRP